jgi:hypothetical protein
MVSEVKIVPGYENYECDIFGNVYSLNYNGTGERRKLKTKTHRNGYIALGLFKNGKQKGFYVHRLVMLTFFGKSDLQVNHINGIKEDNRLENLEYCTALENTTHAIKEGLRNHKGENHCKSYLTESEVIEIKTALLNPYWGINSDLGRKYKTTKYTICDIRKGKTWKHVTID